MPGSDDKPNDAKAEVAQLREQVDALSTHVPPAVSNAAEQAKQYAQQAQATVSEQTEWVTERARQSPVAAVFIACGVGYLLGRIVR